MRTSLSRRFDWPLLMLVLVLGIFGIVMVGSALSGNEIYRDWPWRQALFLGVGLILMFAVTALDYRLLTTLAYPIYLFFLAALVVIKIIGTVAGGAQRWLTIGEYFLQPSELTKIALILALAHFLSSREDKMESILTPIMAIGLLLPAVGLIFWQPNLGTALSIVVIGAIMIVVAGLRVRHGIFFGLLAGAAAAPIWKYALADYMKERITMFVNPATADPDSLYNVQQAMIGIGSGGWLGRGLFRGSQSQLHFLRVRHTDFIFSVTAEELGFIGGAVLIILFAALMLRLVQIASRARDMFGMLIVTGVIAMTLFQVLINIGMNLSIMPVTGIPLPFISYGGSSLWTMLVAIGLVQSVALRHKKIGFDT